MPPESPVSLPLHPEIFHILLSLEVERHGYAILKDVEARTGGRVRLEPSPLYRRLKRLLEAGLIAESDHRPDPDVDDERRRYYRLTRDGRRLLAAEAARLVELAADERVVALAGAGVKHAQR